jgi:hypothetical protein
MRRAIPSFVFVVVSSLLPGQGEPMVLEEAGTGFRTSIALGDVDADGIADLVIGQNGSFQLRRGIAGDGSGRRRVHVRARRPAAPRRSRQRR